MHPLLRRVLHQERLPEPAISLLLRSTRRQVLVELLAEAAPRVASLRAAWDDDRAAARGELRDLVDALLPRMRAEVLRRAAAASWPRRLCGAVDGRMPVDTVELMDRDDVDDAVKERIITDLDRVQERIGTYDRLLDVAAPYLSPGSSGRPLRWLDVASGHGGLPLWLARRAASEGPRLEVTASDVNPAFVRLVRERASREGVRVEARVLDALAMDIEPGSFDIVTCTAAIHHLSPGQVAVLYAEAARVARRGVVFLDGYRSPTQLGVALGLFAVSGASRGALHDCAVSVRKMFVPEELGLLAACTPGAERAVAAWVPPGWSALHGPGA